MIQKDFFNQTSSHLPGAQYQFKCSGPSRMQTSVASEFHTILLLLIGVVSSCSALASFLGHKGTFTIDNRTPGSGRQRRPSIPSIPGSKKSNMGINGSGVQQQSTKGQQHDVRTSQHRQRRSERRLLACLNLHRPGRPTRLLHEVQPSQQGQGRQNTRH